jgi:ABC-type amino acid transport substrate-binding protein
MRAVGCRRGGGLGLLVLAMVVALVGAGCGGDEQPSGSQGTEAPALKGLVSDGVLTVGTELPAPPFWVGKDYDSLTGGFEVDLAKEIAKRLNLGSTKFVEMPFSGLVAGQQCPCDINFSQVTITAREVSSRVCFLDQGVICEQGPAEQIFTQPAHPRTQAFLKRIIAAGRL